MSGFYKHRYLIGATLLLGIVATAYVIANKNKLRRSSKLKNPNPKKILFVGDSVTAVKDYRSGKAITSTYPNMVRTALEPKGITVDVLAKGGETTIWMRRELENLLKSNKYDRVYIYGGINDAWNNSIKPQTTLDNVGAMIDMIKGNGGDAYIISGYKPQGFMDYNKMPVTRYQNSKTDNIPLINEYIAYQNNLATMQKQRGDFNLIAPVDLGTRTGDGIHPNGEGHRMLADAVLKTI